MVDMPLLPRATTPSWRNNHVELLALYHTSHTADKPRKGARGSASFIIRKARSTSLIRSTYGYNLLLALLFALQASRVKTTRTPRKHLGKLTKIGNLQCPPRRCMEPLQYSQSAPPVQSRIVFLPWPFLQHPGNAETTEPPNLIPIRQENR